MLPYSSSCPRKYMLHCQQPTYSALTRCRSIFVCPTVQHKERKSNASPYAALGSRSMTHLGVIPASFFWLFQARLRIEAGPCGSVLPTSWARLPLRLTRCTLLWVAQQDPSLQCSWLRPSLLLSERTRTLRMSWRFSVGIVSRPQASQLTMISETNKTRMTKARTDEELSSKVKCALKRTTWYVNDQATEFRRGFHGGRARQQHASFPDQASCPSGLRAAHTRSRTEFAACTHHAAGAADTNTGTR